VVVDDDESIRRALQRMFHSVGWTVATHASAEDFLAAGDSPPGCLILDLKLPGMSGLDLQRLLADSGRDIAIVVITAHEDEAVRLTALGAGAVDYIVKPFERGA
jgi:two-component system response regulator FixJ